MPRRRDPSRPAPPAPVIGADECVRIVRRPGHKKTARRPAVEPPAPARPPRPRCPHCHAFLSSEGATCRNPRCPTTRALATVHPGPEAPPAAHDEADPPAAHDEADPPAAHDEADPPAAHDAEAPLGWGFQAVLRLGQFGGSVLAGGLVMKLATWLWAVPGVTDVPDSLLVVGPNVFLYAGGGIILGCFLLGLLLSLQDPHDL